MFPLHDRTRRWICRTGFLLGGVLPLLAVCAWSAAIHTSAHQESVRARLKTALGLDVRFDDVSYPRPGVTLLSGLELLDPETGEPLLHARLLEIDGDEPSQTLIASQPEIDAAGLDRLWPAVQRLQRGDESSQPILRISAAELTLRWPQGVQTLVDCAAEVEATESGRVASATFRLAGADPESPAQLGVRWGTSADGAAATTLKLETGDTPLSCSLLAALVRRENWLGSHCSFQGFIRTEETSAGRQSELAGQFEQIALQSVVSDHFPHRLAGTGNLTLDRAIIRDSRLEDATGTIHAGPGVVSTSLLRSAADSLRMRPSGAAHSADEVVEYDELAAAFAWDAKGITIRGQCGAGEPGTVLRSSGGTLLAESTGGPLPVAALIQALVPDSRVQVPATRQTDWLLRALPLPDVQPGDPQSAPHARLRGGPDMR